VAYRVGILVKGGKFGYGLVPILLIALTVADLALLPGCAYAQSVPSQHYNPGDTITYQGTPGTTVMVSSSIPCAMNGNEYRLELNDFSAPPCTIILSVHPVETINIVGNQWIDVPLIGGAWTPDISPLTPLTISGTTGSYSYSTGGGRFKVKAYGNAAGGASSVTADVFVSQSVNANNPEVSVNTANLPSGVYHLSVDNNLVKKIYLGVDAPQAYTLNFKAGWNLISIPINPENDQISYIFSASQMANIDVIWDYNGGDWKYWTTEPGYTNQFSILSPAKGYYVYCYNPMTVTVYGSAPSGPASMGSLPQGWNLIGFQSSSDADISGLYGTADVIWKMENDNWFYWTTEPGYSNQFDTLTPGLGYWIYKN
jgi:hypothetical protein